MTAPRTGEACLVPVDAAARRNALKAYREGRVCVRDVYTPDGTTHATFVSAVVRGFTGQHDVELVDGAWSCTCGGQRCAHVLAVGLVTGHQAGAQEASST